MERKQFLTLCTGSLISVAMLEALQGCTKSYYATTTTTGKNVNVALSEFETTDKNGDKKYRDFILVSSPQLNFPVAVYKNGNTYNALYLECTHRGCQLNPNATGLQCPCHGSEFSTTGKVTASPAERDLQQFPVTVNKESITIEITQQ